MNHTEILKEYTLKQLKEIAPNYKHVSIQDLNGKRVTGWNTVQTPIQKALKECIDKLNGTIYQDGYYYFCFSTASRYNKDSHDKYLYLKGKAPANGLPTPNHNGMSENKNDLLSVTSALSYITQIAELKTENNRLTMEVKRLTDENAVLDAELEEMEREDGLSDGKVNPTIEYLKETAPGFMALADRFLSQRDKTIDLEFLKLQKQPAPNPNPIKRPVKTFETGTPEHLNFIRMLHKNNKEEAMNRELDKLEQVNPEQYQTICTELNLFEDETNND